MPKRTDPPSGARAERGESLIAAVRDGDGRAFERLMQRDAARVVRFAMSQGLNEDDANDIAQETFVALHRNLHRYDPARPYRSWLFAIARNKLRDFFRRRAVLKWVGADDALEDVASSAPSPEAEVSDRADLAAVEQAMRELPEGLRTPLILSSIEGLSLAEIGDTMGISAKAAEVRVYRARTALRKRVG